MSFVVVKGIAHVTALTGFVDGNGAGGGAARLSNLAISAMACFVSSPRCNVGKTVFGGFDNIEPISEAA